MLFVFYVPVVAHIETIAVASSAALIIGILIVVIVVLSVIIIKGRKLHHRHQCTCQSTFTSKVFQPLMLGLYRATVDGFDIVYDYACLYSSIAVDRDIETKPNEVYGLISGQTNDSEFLLIYIYRISSKSCRGGILFHGSIWCGNNSRAARFRYD